MHDCRLAMRCPKIYVERVFQLTDVWHMASSLGNSFSRATSSRSRSFTMPAVRLHRIKGLLRLLYACLPGPTYGTTPTSAPVS